jgi:uncharacterized protein YukE
MASINVNYEELRLAAASIQRYVQEQRQRMRHIEDDLIELGSQWRGEDYRQMLQQWQQINGTGGTSGRMLYELEEQAKDLHWAAQEYEKAQNRTINRGKRLIG